MEETHKRGKKTPVIDGMSIASRARNEEQLKKKVSTQYLGL